MLLVEAQSLDGNYLALSDIISCLQGAITEASTSNSAELKKGKKKKKDREKPLQALQLVLNVKKRQKLNIYFRLLKSKTNCVRI